MSAFFTKRQPKVGARSGTLVIADDAPTPKVRVMHCSADGLHEQQIEDPALLRAALDPDTISWIDVQGFGDESIIRQIGELFSMHPRAVEDVVNIPQRPKLEAFDKLAGDVTCRRSIPKITEQRSPSCCRPTAADH